MNYCCYKENKIINNIPLYTTFFCSSVITNSLTLFLYINVTYLDRFMFFNSSII